MEEDLITASWKKRNAPPGFGYAGGFQDILTAYNGLNHRGANKRYKDNQDLLQAQIDHLTALKEQLEREEDRFFDIFGIRCDDKKESFAQLKNKIKQWNSTGADKLINDARVGNDFYRILQVFRQQASFAEITDEEWNSLLTEALSEDTTLIDRLTTDDDVINVPEILNKILKGKKFATKGKSSLIDNIIITLDEQGKITVKSERGKISASMQLKLVKELREHLKKEKANVKAAYDTKKMFNDAFNILESMQNGISSEAQQYIKKALTLKGKSALENYALNSSVNQIKGFLGEVYNNAFLLFMSNGNLSAIEKITPTGHILNTKGDQLVIDTWLDGFGIQVKNYEKNKVMNKGFTVTKDYNAYYFITEVLQMSPTNNTSNTASVADILLNFFTAYDYNRDYGSSSTPDGYKFWQDARARMDKKYKDANAFTNIMMPYLDKLIGIDQAFETKDGMFLLTDEQRYFTNTFFNISGNYIPSSFVVQAIIDNIQKKKDSIMADIITAQFETSYTKSSLDVWNPDITNNDVMTVFGKRDKYAASTKIKYTLTLDVNKIANQLL